VSTRSSPDRKRRRSMLFKIRDLHLSKNHQRVGLFGGSFNPAHSGHLALTNEAIKRLKLDAVWWLVSPLNPLKSNEGMATFEQRLNSARQIASTKNIFVTAIEQELGTSYTSETVAQLKGSFPDINFVWLMGADNLSSIDRWKDWTKLVESVPIAVFDRAPYSMAASQSKMAIRYKRQRRKTNFEALVNDKTPSWAYVFMPRNPQSATALRKQGHWRTE
jgi:nicotinate-nucleotide adenylyltransferase